MKLTHRATMLACYNGYITQAICINLAPLFYLTFQRSYGLSLGQISGLIALNFSAQLAIDLAASVFSKRMNLRLFTVLAHVFTVLGLLGLPWLPEVLPPFAGLGVAVLLLGVGGGFTEVMISPILEACPTDQKSANMCFLHSFYCWGQASVALLSGIFLAFFEVDRYWKVLPILWALIPLLGAIAFCIVPIYRLPEEEGRGGTKRLLGKPMFWSCLVMMICAGGAEMIMGQWASGFAESALGVPKSVGDLAGPCFFAVMMGLSRALYGKISQRVSLDAWLGVGCGISLTAYALAAFVPIPAVAFLGCGLCGFGVGAFWPGVLSRASARIPTGGVAMFAILALAGDIGCLVAPSVAGTIAEHSGGDLRTAFCFAMVFPLLNLCVIMWSNCRPRRKK